MVEQEASALDRLGERGQASAGTIASGTLAPRAFGATRHAASTYRLVMQFKDSIGQRVRMSAAAVDGLSTSLAEARKSYQQADQYAGARYGFAAGIVAGLR
ncbi:hypothetical protein ACQP2F_15540 [Actinoplanes sp. CA-030573]|uniref:hypothetical protein n=1 Tax=Actinoplanes sp. CA-030573 TaxID=3239898 RepID=UPI003D91D9DF